MQIGDRVRITGNCNRHCFERGDVVYVRYIWLNETTVRCDDVNRGNGDDSGNVDAMDYELVDHCDCTPTNNEPFVMPKEWETQQF